MANPKNIAPKSIFFIFSAPFSHHSLSLSQLEFNYDPSRREIQQQSSIPVIGCPSFSTNGMIS